VLIGAGATACMDVWAQVLQRGFGVRSLDFGLLGRWVAHIPRGKVAHASIAKAEPIRGERALGWATHYAIGCSFAFLLLAIWGLAWARSPTILPAIIVGLATLPAPLLVLQPCMGLGIAASKTPRPGAARVKSLVTHLVYGVGLYGAALVLARLWGG
jgi:hypothetical protein